MKTKFYRLSYRLLSFLSDKTNGFHLFAKYKVMLGTLIIGLSAFSCANELDEDADDSDEYPQVTCYFAGPGTTRGIETDTNGNPAFPADETEDPKPSLYQN
jgi:hypothetical protein